MDSQITRVRNLPRYLNVLLVLALISGVALYANLVALARGAFAAALMGVARYL